MDSFADLQQIRPQAIWEGLLARAVHGERITLAVVEVDPDAELPEHAHENEQLGIVISGSLTLNVGGDERVLGPGSSYVIPPHTPHSGRGGPAGSVVVDVFSPVRDDWRAIAAQEPSPVRWPGS